MQKEKPGSPLTIFIVENHEDTLRALERYLSGLGHSVRQARSLQEALELIPTTPCDMLLSDIGLPDGDGWDLLCRLELPASVYPVAMSGYDRLSDREKSTAVGYKLHLIKPFLPQDLDTALQEAERHRRRHARS